MSNLKLLYALCDAVVFTGEAMVEGHAALVKDGHILDIVSSRLIPSEAIRVDFSGKILCHGFVDLQVNGGGGLLLNNQPVAEACLHIAKAHRQYGTTHILPTCITDSPDILQKALAASRAARKTDPTILGLHIEGPHLAKEARGVHKPDFLRGLNAADLLSYHPEPDETLLITVAPETVSADQIKALHEAGCLISLGHTRALAEQIHAALKAGASCFTHLYNGMGGMNAREPGVTGVALDDSNSWCSIIADGHHVSAEMIRIAARAKPAGKVFLVSDAMPPAACETPQPFQLYGEPIHVKNGRCIDHDGRLAGSAVTLLDAVHHCIKIGIDFDEALRMATLYPAAFIGRDKNLGKLLPGFAAHVIALSPDLASVAAWLKPI